MVMVVVVGVNSDGDGGGSVDNDGNGGGGVDGDGERPILRFHDLYNGFPIPQQHKRLPTFHGGGRNLLIIYFSRCYSRMNEIFWPTRRSYFKSHKAHPSYGYFIFSRDI